MLESADRQHGAKCATLNQMDRGLIVVDKEYENEVAPHCDPCRDLAFLLMRQRRTQARSATAGGRLQDRNLERDWHDSAGKKPFTLEFRRASDNQLVDVGAVNVAPVMEMAGMGPMMATTLVTPSNTPGRYTAIGNLTMSGHWKVNITFGTGKSAQINLSAE